MKKTTIIIILILVFVIIGVVVYLFARSNKNNEVTEKVTTSTGLGNVLANTDTGTFSALLGLF